MNFSKNKSYLIQIGTKPLYVSIIIQSPSGFNLVRVMSDRFYLDWNLATNHDHFVAPYYNFHLASFILHLLVHSVTTGD